MVVSPNPDFTSILVREGKIFSITHYESPRPGVAYLSELEQHADGALTVSVVFCRRVYPVSDAICGMARHRWRGSFLTR